MGSFHDRLEKYAEVAVRLGVNVQPGQTLVVDAATEAAEFVRLVVGKAYEAGAKSVHVEWSDPTVTQLTLQHAEDAALQHFPAWKATGYEEFAKEGAAFLTIHANHPDLLKNVDPARAAMSSKARAAALKPFSQYRMTGTVSWSIVALPTPDWAAKVFPELAPEDALAQLWDYVFAATRINTEDPVQAWKAHIETLESRLHYLNQQRFQKLRYRGPGTDLTVELPARHLWVGGGIRNAQTTFFVPNIPTEEVFTAPQRDGVNGTVRSTKPLNYGGQVINDFSLTFEHGRVVSFSAETGYDVLKSILGTDEGSHYLGEIALVPDDSPISRLDVVFYDTGYDENASCHVAIGAAYPLCIKGGTGMTADALAEAGANNSLMHVDFMIGSAALDIDGETRDGKTVALFRNGNWAI